MQAPPHCAPSGQTNTSASRAAADERNRAGLASAASSAVSHGIELSEAQQTFAQVSAC
jgi:hypothetical protein